MKKHTLFTALCVLAALVVVLLQPTAASAAEQSRYCQGCDAEIPLSDWTALGGEVTETVTLTAGEHYYLTETLSGTPASGVLVQGAGCIDLNGFDITAGTECIALSCGAGTTKLMGSGTVSGSCATSETGATIHTSASAEVHL